MFRSKRELDDDLRRLRLDVDVMLPMPAIVENCFSSGVATSRGHVCGLVPRSVAPTVACREVDIRQVAHRQLTVGDEQRRGCRP